MACEGTMTHFARVGHRRHTSTNCWTKGSVIHLCPGQGTGVVGNGARGRATAIDHPRAARFHAGKNDRQNRCHLNETHPANRALRMLRRA
jgi:hypothetical protein